MDDLTIEDELLPPRLKLAIGAPWDSPFFWNKTHLSMMRLVCAFRDDAWEVQYFQGAGCMPAARHIDLCEQALAWGADYILILGADQEYPDDLLSRLIARLTSVGGHGMIAAMVPMRGYVDWQPMRPFQPLAWRGNDCNAVTHGDGRPAVITRQDGDFVRGNIIGSGVLLFAAALLDTLAKPWFYERVDPLTMRRVADMDSRFVQRIQQETGTPLYIDTTILVQHIHDMSIDDSFQQRFADWADPATPGIDRRIVRFQAELPTMEEATHAQACAECASGRPDCAGQ